MGLTKLTLEVGNPARKDVFEDVEFIVDSGAIYSVVPRVILERLGIPQLAEKDFRLHQIRPYEDGSELPDSATKTM